MVCKNCGKESTDSTQICSGCGAILNAQQGQQFTQQGQQFPQQGQQFPQQGQQFPQQEQQFPQQGQQFPQQEQQFPQQGQQFPQQGQQFPQQGMQFPQQEQQFPQQGQQFPQQGQQFPQQGQQFPQQGQQQFPPGQQFPQQGQQQFPPGQQFQQQGQSAPPVPKGFLGLSKKHLIIIGAAALVVIGIVVVLIITLGGNSYESKEFFDVGGDEVPSVMYVLGEKRKISEVTVYSSKSADKIVVEYSVSENQGDEMEEYAGALVDDFDFIALDEYDFSGKRGSGFRFVKVSDEDDDHIVIVTIDFNNSGYTLTIERREGELNIGPGDNGDTDNGDEPDNGYIKGWPTDELPSGFPEYPDGQPKHGIDGAKVNIIIEDTGIKAFEGYMADLEAWGFEFGEPISDGVYNSSAKDWKLILAITEEFGEAMIVLSPAD